MKRIFCLTVMLTLCACEHWEKPGATPEDFKTTKAMCKYNAAENFPPDLHQVLRAPAYATPDHSGCIGSADIPDCLRAQSVVMPPSYETIDENEQARAKNVRECLVKKGWHKVESE